MGGLTDISDFDEFKPDTAALVNQRAVFVPELKDPATDCAESGNCKTCAHKLVWMVIVAIGIGIRANGRDVIKCAVVGVVGKNAVDENTMPV